ncbi:MAG: threonine synthase [Candidatus Eremiobacterota bacterium]
MRYVSTRGGVAPVSFRSAVMMGLAEDGGLLVPERVPSVGPARSGYAELALEVMRPFADDVPELDELIRAAYALETYLGPVAPLRPVGDRFVLELFHGPTLAFKDVALQLLGRLFESTLALQGGRLNILAATSGDTGSAAISGVRGRAGIQIFVMHPRGRVSRVQELQMTSVTDPNVHNLAIRGTFDDCQALLKRLSSDLEFKRRCSLGAVNSVNWARVLAQTVYYFAAFHQLGTERVSFCVPTGNFGDVLAGWYAARMGLPVARLAVATNTNDILSRFFATGEYSLGAVEPTLAPAMDIQVASNFERYLYYRMGEDPSRVAAAMREFAATGRLKVEGEDPLWAAGRATREDILRTIREVHDRHGTVLDPHTAVGWHVASQLELPPPVVCLATAHPAKFPEAIREATGRDDLARHPRVEALEGLPTRCTVLDASEQAVRDYLSSCCAPA